MNNIIFKEFNTYTIAKSYACAIEYGDLTGLDKEEATKVEQFIGRLPSRPVLQWSSESDLSVDEITGLLADCLECTVLYEEK